MVEVIRPQRLKPSEFFNKNNLKTKVRSNSVEVRDLLPDLSKNYTISVSSDSEDLIINPRKRVEENKYELISSSESESMSDLSIDKSPNSPAEKSPKISSEKSPNISLDKGYLSMPSSGLNISNEIKLFAESHKRSCNCPSILIVDDQFVNRLILKEFCNQLGLKCAEAEDGKIAVNYIVNQKKSSCCEGIVLILMDLNMPRMDGIQATKEILNFEKEGIINKNMKIVAVTAFASEEEKEKCFKAGMVDFIRKPVSMTNLVNLVKK